MAQLPFWVVSQMMSKTHRVEQSVVQGGCCNNVQEVLYCCNNVQEVLPGTGYSTVFQAFSLTVRPTLLSEDLAEIYNEGWRLKEMGGEGR